MKLSRFTAPVLAFALLGTTGAMVAQYGPPQGPPPPGYGPGYDRGGWDAPPPEFREFQRLGFHDGIEGARKDIENHRRPNVKNRDEYRHPNVPGNVRHDYKEAFRRGYNVGINNILNGGPQRY